MSTYDIHTVNPRHRTLCLLLPDALDQFQTKHGRPATVVFAHPKDMEDLRPMLTAQRLEQHRGLDAGHVLGLWTVEDDSPSASAAPDDATAILNAV